MTAVEVNFDGLVGPSHNYGGLSFGNVASMASGGNVSNPKAAALQGLGKMRRLLELGLPQGVLPPHERPFVPALRQYGFTGEDGAVVERAAKDAPELLLNMSSAAAMWTANAATISPSADTEDGKLHITPANLAAMVHRSIEHPFTARVLQHYFPEGDHFAHHAVIPSTGTMGDEGAANHGRLCSAHGKKGVELFVWGRSAFERLAGWTFPPRQALEASQAIARAHGVIANAVFARQSKEAIEAGAFHNDVVGVANGPAYLFHEKSFEDKQTALSDLTRACEAVGFAPQFIEVAEADVPLADAIKSYLFNSQLVTLPDGRMALILPTDAEENAASRAWVEGAVSGNGPIAEAHFLDVKQSMRNGGGPACLRLRVALTEDEQAAMHQDVLLNEAKIVALEAWVEKHYRDRLTPEDLGDPKFLTEVRWALDELTEILGLGSIYDFQRG